MAASSAGEDESQLRLALVVYTAIFAGKLVAYFITGLMALLAESLHTLTDLAITGFLLVAIAWSRKGPDADHAFGHGRAQNVAALIAATVFLSFTSLELIREAIPRLAAGGTTEFSNLPLAIGVIAASMLAAGFPLIALWRNRQSGAAARAQLQELINDELGLLAALTGIGFVAAGIPLADPIATLVVAGIIAYNGARLLKANASVLLGSSPGPEYLESVRSAALAVPGVLGVHDLRAEYVGPGVVHAGLHVTVARGTLVEDADGIAGEVGARIRDIAGCQWCVVHVDPAPAG